MDFLRPERMQQWRPVLLALLVTTVSFASSGQTVGESAPLLAVQGAVQQRLLLDREALDKLSWRQFTEVRQFGQGATTEQVTVRYQGVPLREILDQAVLAPDRRTVRRAVVVLTARDGYQTVFSWGELYNSRVGEGVILVRSEDDRDLLQVDGWPALRSLYDTRSGTRHVRWLQKIEVLLVGGA